MKNIADVYPLSPMQQGMLYHSLLAPHTGVYVEIVSCELHGWLNEAAFCQSWQRVIDRHGILRTAFVSEKLKEPVQVVYQNVQLTIAREDWSASSPERQSERLAAYLEAEQARGFNLETAPLMRLALLRLSERAWQFVWVYHHILMDGWSNAILFQEVITYYQAYVQNRSLHLDLPRPYRDYIVWLKRQRMGEAETYWRKQLSGLQAPTPLVASCASRLSDEEDDADSGPNVAERETWIDVENTRRLQALAGRLNLTLNTLVCAAWGLLLSRYTGEEDVCFGVTVSGRPTDIPGAEGMLGLFINTLPVRMQVDSGQTVQDWLKAIQSHLVAMRQYEWSPLVEVQGWSEIPRNQPLFETILVYENYPIRSLAQDQEDGADLVIAGVQSIEQTNYPITAVAGASDRLMLKLVYDCRQFSAEWIDHMLGHWARVLASFSSQPGDPLGKICLLTDAEYHKIVIEWNQNWQEFPITACAHDLFDTQAIRCPQSIAIDFAGQTVTYHELYYRANQLAHYLIRAGVSGEMRVGLCLERSIDMVIAILAVLKAGGAYLPLDPAYPADRLSFMIADAGVSLLLTHTSLAPSLPQGAARLIALDAIQPELSRQVDSPPIQRSTPDSLAYIIYTSGSTGQPKGVLLEHRGLCNLVTQYGRILDLTPGDRMLQFFSFSFDGSVADIFTTLSNGATLCYGPAEQMMPGPELAGFLREHHITHGMVTPSALSVLPANDLPDLKVLLTGGELCTRSLLEPWDTGRRLINAYGPTEATVISTLYEVHDVSGEQQNIPIGRPLPNTTLYILDPQHNPVPVGVAGEIYVGGVGIARGYLNRPDLTTARFIPDPFNPAPGARLYKTGDLGRFRPDGVVEYLGRSDDQVKIRGFRIELGEIEAVLRRHPDLCAAVVVALPDPAVDTLHQLVAYVVLRDGASITLAELQAFLRQGLPEYMLPRALVILDALPLTPSGKVNRKALPPPGDLGHASRQPYTPPRDALETRLCQIWEEVLNVRPVGIQDSFFDLGGHSLLAVRMMMQIKEKLDQEVSLITLFQSPTVELLADTLRRADEVAAAVGIMSTPDRAATAQGPDEGERILLPLQARGANPPLFFVHPSGGSTHWYTEIAEALGKDQPSYAFQARGINGDRPIHTTIPEMAAFYVQALRNFQPYGPYRLASWSLGVIIVYEMAQVLVAEGEQVPFLAMLDQGPVLPHPKPIDHADYLVQTFGHNIPLDVEALRRLSREDQIARVLEIGKKQRFIYPETTRSEFTHFITLMQTQVEAWRSYQPCPYPGRITLFRAAGQDHPLELGSDLGWGRLAAGGVEVITVPGDHLSMIHKPHVRTLANAMKKHLAAAESPANEPGAEMPLAERSL